MAKIYITVPFATEICQRRINRGGYEGICPDGNVFFVTRHQFRRAYRKYGCLYHYKHHTGEWLPAILDAKYVPGQSGQFRWRVR